MKKLFCLSFLITLSYFCQTFGMQALKLASRAISSNSNNNLILRNFTRACNTQTGKINTDKNLNDTEKLEISRQKLNEFKQDIVKLNETRQQISFSPLEMVIYPLAAVCGVIIGTWQIIKQNHKDKAKLKQEEKELKEKYEQECINYNKLAQSVKETHEFQAVNAITSMSKK